MSESLRFVQNLICCPNHDIFSESGGLYLLKETLYQIFEWRYRFGLDPDLSILFLCWNISVSQHFVIYLFFDARFIWPGPWSVPFIFMLKHFCFTIFFDFFLFLWCKIYQTRRYYFKQKVLDFIYEKCCLVFLLKSNYCLKNMYFQYLNIIFPPPFITIGLQFNTMWWKQKLDWFPDYVKFNIKIHTKIYISIKLCNFTALIINYQIKIFFNCT